MMTIALLIGAVAGLLCLKAGQKQLAEQNKGAKEPRRWNGLAATGAFILVLTMVAMFIYGVTLLT